MALIVDSRPLAVTRIAIGVASLLITLEDFVMLGSIASGKMTMPLFDWFPAVDDQSVGIVFVLGVVGSIALIAGFQSRVVAGMLAAVTALVLLWDQQTYSSHQLLLFCLCAYLTMGQPGAALSIDARIRGRRDKSVPYWPVLLIMTQTSIVYFFTALAKVNPVFLGGDMIRSAM